MKNPPTLVWHRLDLRVGDNPALTAAVQSGGAVIPVFIHAPDEENPWTPGEASNWWLDRSLRAFDEHLRRLGSRLVIRRGPSLDTLLELVAQTGAARVFWNRRYEPSTIERDLKIKAALRDQGLKVESFNGSLLNEPWAIKNQSGRPFKVFTAFWKHCLTHLDLGSALPAPKSLPEPRRWPKSLPLDSLALAPKVHWASGLAEAWTPGEAGAVENLKRFLKEAFAGYATQRNRPDTAGTSRLSPHLHFGEISPRLIWYAVEDEVSHHSPAGNWRSSQFLSELGWREFACHLLFHFPATPHTPLRPEFQKFPCRNDPEWLRAWQKGRTGYPIVDAGMRELWTTGWMHNRVRMIAASFLVKDLLLPWQDGARWFWNTLVDADLANNTLGWQWTAGCGADAAPYFRIFNPTTQGAKFDPEGHYVRRWCPELAALPNEWIHQPHKAPSEILQSARVELDANYPRPIVSHTIAREVALEAYSRIKA